MSNDDSRREAVMPTEDVTLSGTVLYGDDCYLTKLWRDS